MPDTKQPDAPTLPKRGRGGRPKSEPGTGRLTTVSTRVSDSELAVLRAKAVQMGMKPADWLRQAALSRRLPSPPAPAINRIQYAELGRLASNLNQLTKAANQGTNVIVSDDLLSKVLAEVGTLRLALLGVSD